MNEIIQKLIAKAGTDVSGKWISMDNAEKFAELIVRECADIATINSHQHRSAGHYVLKHFGVEE
jgi:hypothetical protein